MNQLFTRKPIADLQGGEHGLRRVLGAGDLIMLAIGAVIGAGIFGAIGTAAAGQIGPSGEVIRSAPVRRWCFPSCCSAWPARSPRCATPSWPR